MVLEVFPAMAEAAPAPSARCAKLPAMSKLRVVYSNRIEQLADALVGQVREEGADLFAMPALLVPNRNVERWLRLHAARKVGIAAWPEAKQLRRFLGELAAQARRGEDAGDATTVTRILDVAALEELLLTLLGDEALFGAGGGDDELRPARDYLRGAGEDVDTVALRRVQLASELARLYDECALSRPELLAGWLDGQPARREETRWQRRIWRELFAAGGLVERRAEQATRSGEPRERWLTLDAYFREVDFARLALPERLHVFGLSYVASVFHEILARLAEVTELRLYTLNPCREYWDDVRTVAEAQREARRNGGADDDDDPFRLLDDTEQPALRLWGRPGRENIRLLGRLTDYDFDGRFHDPAEDDERAGRQPSLLHALQSDILGRRVAPGEHAEPAPAPHDERAGSFAGDGSVRFFACPGVRREVETIASEIWRLVEESERTASDGHGERLRFCDVAVLLPRGQEALYQAHVAAVFAEAHGLPHSMVDVAPSSASRVVEAALLLLDLPRSSLSRRALLGVMTHPTVLARCGASELGDEGDGAEWADQWARWCESLGVVHGADHADHASTYIDRDLYNWDQGLRRLALGAFMAGPDDGAPLDGAAAVALGGERYLPEAWTEDQLDRATTFTALARSLIADAHDARDALRTMDEWTRFLRRYLTSYLGATPGGGREAEADRRALGRCLAAVAELAQYGLDGQRVPWRVPCELLRSRLASLEGGLGGYLAGGVVVSSFVPMRAIPFRAVFVAGLGEGQFPASERRNQLDLRGERRRAGDVTPRERDKYMFLETLLSARERFYLSYVARDPLTGDALEPSPVVLELRRMIDNGYVDSERLVSAPKLRRWEEGDQRPGEDAAKAAERLRLLPPGAGREWLARELGRELRAHCASGSLTLDSAVLDDLASDQCSPLVALLRAPWPSRGAARPDVAPEDDAARAATGETMDTVRLSAPALRRFLECPLQGWARQVLRLGEDEDEDLAGREDEVFAAGRLARTVLLRETFLRAQGEGDAALERAYDELREPRELAGKLPVGPFARVERDGDLALLRSWRAQVAAQCGGASVLRRVRFGRALAAGASEEVRDPIVLDGVELAGRTVRVELHGVTEPLLSLGDGNEASLVLKTGRPKDKDGLRGFLDQMLLSASGEARAGHVALLLGPDKSTRIELETITQEAARTWLSAMAADLLGREHAYLMPCEAVLKLHEIEQRGGRSSLGEQVTALLDHGHASCSSQYGPVPHFERYPIPDEDAATAMIARRFGSYFARLRAEAPPAKRGGHQ